MKYKKKNVSELSALSNEFAEILTATGGKKVMAMLAEGHVPDIIVSDINMPEGDGYTLCKTLKNSERYSHIPVVLLTSRGEERSQSDSYRIGAEGYMPKPFEVETLLELLRSIMRRKAEIRKKYLGLLVIYRSVTSRYNLECRFVTQNII